MLAEMRRFFVEEDGEIVEWAVFMLILLAFTVAIILAVGDKAQTMWENIQTLLDVTGEGPSTRVVGATPTGSPRLPQRRG